MGEAHGALPSQRAQFNLSLIPWFFIYWLSPVPWVIRARLWAGPQEYTDELSLLPPPPLQRAYWPLRDQKNKQAILIIWWGLKWGKPQGVMGTTRDGPRPGKSRYKVGMQHRASAQWKVARQGVGGSASCRALGLWPKHEDHGSSQVAEGDTSTYWSSQTSQYQTRHQDCFSWDETTKKKSHYKMQFNETSFLETSQESNVWITARSDHYKHCPPDGGCFLLSGAQITSPKASVIIWTTQQGQQSPAVTKS